MPLLRRQAATDLVIEARALKEMCIIYEASINSIRETNFCGYITFHYAKMRKSSFFSSIADNFLQVLHEQHIFCLNLAQDC